MAAVKQINDLVHKQHMHSEHSQIWGYEALRLEKSRWEQNFDGAKHCVFLDEKNQVLYLFFEPDSLSPSASPNEPSISTLRNRQWHQINKMSSSHNNDPI